MVPTTQPVPADAPVAFVELSCSVLPAPVTSLPVVNVSVPVTVVVPLRLRVTLAGLAIVRFVTLAGSPAPVTWAPAAL